MKLKTLIFLTSMILFLSSCSIPLKSDQPDIHTYRLSPYINMLVNTSSETKPRLNINLYMPQVEVTPGLDDQHIVIFKTPYEQDHIAHSQWPTELPSYLHSVITDALSASNIFTTVSTKRMDNKYNYKLVLKVSAFQVELPQPTSPTARVVIKMEAFAIQAKNKKLLMNKRYNLEVNNVEVRVSVLVEALNNVLSKALGLLARDLESSLHGQ